MLHGTHLTPERRQRLVGLCATISGDRGAAEDLAQETLLEAWRSGHKVHDTSGLDRWLAAIARNVCRRWARRQGRDVGTLARLDPDEAPDELERGDLLELLDRALALLPPETREALIERYVNDAPRAEIAARLGVSEDAVSMRLARGKAVLRSFLAESDWSDTRVWCNQCARQRLVMRREPGGISFRCPACHPDTDELAVDLRFDNPFYAGLVGDLVRPATILRRIRDWSARYFDPHADRVDCTRCGRQASLRPYARDDVPDDPASALGLLARCPACGQQAWSSLPALAHGHPQLRAFRRRHPRLRTVHGGELDCGGVSAVLLRCEDALGSASADVVFARDTLRVLAVHGASG